MCVLLVLALSLSLAHGKEWYEKMAGTKITTMKHWTTFLSQNYGRVIIVEAYQKWCPPCERSAPFYSQAAVQVFKSEFGGKFAFAKVDVQENSDFMYRYGVKRTPSTLMFDKNGELVSWYAGKHAAVQEYIDWMMSKLKE